MVEDAGQILITLDSLQLTMEDHTGCIPDSAIMMKKQSNKKEAYGRSKMFAFFQIENYCFFNMK